MNWLDREEWETDEGMYTTTSMERLLRATEGLGTPQECPRCHSNSTLFFGDPDGEHHCAACQILKEAGLLDEEYPQGTTDDF